MERTERSEESTRERSESSNLNLNSISQAGDNMSNAARNQQQSSENSTANSALPKVTIEGLDNEKKPVKEGIKDGGKKSWMNDEGADSGSSGDNAAGKKVIKDGGPKDKINAEVSGPNDAGAGKKVVKDGGPKDPVKDKFDGDKPADKDKFGGKDKFDEKDKFGGKEKFDEKKGDKFGDKHDDKFGGKDKFDDKFGGKGDKLGGKKDDDMAAIKKEKAEYLQNNKNEKAKLEQKKPAQFGLNEMSDYDLLIKKNKK